jgi:hypothetical protein
MMGTTVDVQNSGKIGELRDSITPAQPQNIPLPPSIEGCKAEALEVGNAIVNQLGVLGNNQVFEHPHESREKIMSGALPSFQKLVACFNKGRGTGI